ncbi:MAG TPA: metalloregulator ArsR/SmtB family transcription factor [Ktedonobacterales bacterium]|jgi:ArsR family transcriptional regulator|nr:metalloregulator ArsR/SmtB family transcription factor [Ktedonobacterales bacterium]
MDEAGKLGEWSDYVEEAKMLKALADGVRLNIVRVLARADEVNVTDLVQTLLVSQPLVSWHLAALRRHGLVKTRRQGRQVYCSLDRARCRQCLALLGEIILEPATTERVASPTAHQNDKTSAPASTTTARPTGRR